MKRVAALVPNVLGVSPGQRVRIETWARLLPAAGWEVDFYPFEDDRLHAVLYGQGRPLLKAALVLSCYARQLVRILRQPRCDALFIYREAALIGPAVLERLALRMGVPLVYDLDDPVFLPYRSPMNGWFSLLKCPGKTHTLLRLSNRVTAINRLIAGYAAQFNPQTAVIPNAVDVTRYRPSPGGDGGTCRMVWLGSHSTMPNLDAIREPLQAVQSRFGTPLRIIGAGNASIDGVHAEVRQWSAQTEVADLADCSIGLVPLPDEPWNRWKFFFKTIQYMAVGLPVVARRMGSNAEVIEEGVNGFLVETNEEWTDRLTRLITDPELRASMGEAARQTVVERYSLQTQQRLVASVFDSLTS